MGEQNETGLEGELSENLRPAVLAMFWGLSDDPELALRMVNEGDGTAGGRTDGPTASQKINLRIGVDAPSQMQGQMEIPQARVGTRAQEVASFLLGFGPSGVGG